MYISALYLLLFLLSCVAVGRLLRKTENKNGSYYIVLFILITVVCLAYFAYSIALDRGAVLVANQFTYLDGTFMFVFFFFCICDLCGIKLNHILTVSLMLGCLYFLLLAFSAGYIDVFYKSYDIGHYEGASYIITEFGYMYNLYFIWSGVFFIAPIFVVIYAFIKKKKTSYKHLIALIALLSVILILFLVQNILGLGFDLLPVGYVLMEYVILGIMNRILKYDIARLAVSTNESTRDSGYIIFDANRNFVGCDASASFYFPELNELYIDRKVKNSFIRKEFVEWIFDCSDGPKTKIFERCGKKVLCAFKQLVLKDSKSYGYLVELRDDTIQQEFIEKLNELNSDLEEAVQNANSANVAKSRFLANMSHEIRTPIHAILGMNEIAMRECGDEKINSYLQDVANAGNNLLAIINDILDFSKIEAGKIDFVEDDYELQKLIKDVKDLIGLKAEQKNLKFTVIADEKLPAVLYGDVNRLRQVIVNLLNNSVKYTHAGEVTLNISGTGHGDGFELCIAVKDTGIGIKPEDMQNLFTSFSRLDTKANKNIEGTGLGLAITGKLVEGMQGKIDVASEYGKGSVFTVLLPQKVIDQTPISEYRPKTTGTATENISEITDASGVSILVVDDNLINLKVAEGLLKPTKAKVTTCESGPKCLELIKQQHFDLIMLDHMMPEMDGIETLHKAKEEENLCKDSVYVALTANAISGIREMYLSEGFDDYLSKPIDKKLLNKIIAGILSTATN